MTDIAAAPVKIQVEATQSTAPVSEALAQTIGGSINYLLRNAGQVGDVVESFLDEATFQSLRSTDWVLCDGRAVVGSQFESLTGYSSLPDYRGLYGRMKDNGAGVDTHGDLALGATYLDQFKAHVHSAPLSYNPAAGGPFINSTAFVQGSNDGTIRTTTNTGGLETNPKTMVVNKFVKIN